MDAREILLDGVQQVVDWYADALEGLDEEQMNFHPGGAEMTIGWNAWHWYRTVDNLTHLVFKREKPIWVVQGYAERLGLPPMIQGTGMADDEALALAISDAKVLRDYGSLATSACLDVLRTLDEATFDEIQQVKPLGEMPKWRVFRQVIMTHGFMHLGEISAIKGQLGVKGPM